MEVYRMLTTVIAGRGCVPLNSDLFLKAGKKAAVVTGRRSGQISGALDDVIDTLKSCDAKYIVIDSIDNNPDLKNIKEAADIARREHVDYVIGIGGGSPLDAAKAVSVLCTNDMSPLELFEGKIANDPLAIMAIPTTAGTGSEVTPYSVLTVKEKGTKLSFSDNRIFPTYAFLDYKYTESLNRDITIDTAIDSFTHAFEGYISSRKTRLSRSIALESMKVFMDTYTDLRDFNMTEKAREDLLYASMLAGIVISQTGTTALHSMGYALTYNIDISHGRANGLLLPAYIDELNKDNGDMFRDLAVKLNIEDISVLADMVRDLFPEKVSYNTGDINRFASETLVQKNLKYTPARFNFDRISGIFKSIEQ